MKIVILAGGIGTRLWPVSRTCFPKQFLQFGDGLSLMQKTIRRFLAVYSAQDIWIVTQKEYLHLVKAQASAIDGFLEQQILIEPERKNTGPAICLAVEEMLKRGVPRDTCFLVSSSDHLIAPEKTFLEALQPAEEIAREGYLVAFGIQPTKPETGYGYIKASPLDHCMAHKIDCFVEKPDRKTAEEFVLSGEYLWNAGIFMFQIETFLAEVERHAPMLKSRNFDEMSPISVDKAIMELSNQTAVIPLDISWSDVGSWDSLYEVMDKDAVGNVKIGDVVAVDTQDCLIMGDQRLVTTIGLDNLLVVDTGDALFIGKRGESQRVKTLVEHLQNTHKREISEHLTTHRPWGAYTVLEEGERYKIKRIVVHPQAQLSLQMHYHRSEHWVVIKGTAQVTIGEKRILVHENESVYVPKSTVHRLENPGKVDLEIIEVQVGEYVGEDDITRLQDVYGREVISQTIL